MNVLYIVIDTQRADHLSCYGYFRKTSPNLDKLAEEGVLFENCIASDIATGPAFTTLITGMFGMQHRFLVTPHNYPNVGASLDDNIPTIAELFWDAGYTTVALDNIVNFKSHPKHFVRGYEFYINATGTSRSIHHHVTADQINERLIPWLETFGRKRRFFAFVHYWDPHGPYNQPEEFKAKFRHEEDMPQPVKAEAGYEYIPGWGKVDEIRPDVVDLYDGEVAYVDDRIGQVLSALDELGLLDETLVVITADHGELLGEHNFVGHAYLYQPNIHIPLILWRPGLLPQGVRIPHLVQSADIVPTILDLAGIEIPPTMGGQSLLPLIRGESEGRGFAASTWKAGPQAWRSFQRGEWKLMQIWDLTKKALARLELYNLKSDPVEAVNLADSEREKVAQLTWSLEPWFLSFLGPGEEDPLLTYDPRSPY